MAENLEKKSIWKHEHPLYEWIALFVTVIIILVMSGWIYLSYFDIPEQDMTIWTTHKSSTTSTTKTTSEAADTSDIDNIIKDNDTATNGVDSSDYNSNDITDTQLGVN